MLDVSIVSMGAVNHRRCDYCQEYPVDVLELRLSDESEQNYRDTGEVCICEFCLEKMFYYLKSLKLKEK